MHVDLSWFFQPVPPLPTELNGTPPPVPKKYTSKQASLTWLSPTLRTFLYYTYLLLHGWSYELVYKLTIIIFTVCIFKPTCLFSLESSLHKETFSGIGCKREKVCVCEERERERENSCWVIIYMIYEACFITSIVHWMGDILSITMFSYLLYSFIKSTINVDGI